LRGGFHTLVVVGRGRFIFVSGFHEYFWAR
jgi:hypothetical protein